MDTDRVSLENETSALFGIYSTAIDTLIALPYCQTKKISEVFFVVDNLTLLSVRSLHLYPDIKPVRYCSLQLLIVLSATIQLLY